ncbi:hypothetical protein TGRUB_254570A [Toxoplasma gondii RUB]|uniref:Uncharacterized protein n=1 Tax=Toxoplasma gondii RUB TaxID=935652 RepID=A0A086LTH1_TOXGO|nr:hypothetical protein TGRUB_254570A [Toxoplasma gondii RUB]
MDAETPTSPPASGESTTVGSAEPPAPVGVSEHPSAGDKMEASLEAASVESVSPHSFSSDPILSADSSSSCPDGDAAVEREALLAQNAQLRRLLQQQASELERMRAASRDPRVCAEPGDKKASKDKEEPVAAAAAEALKKEDELTALRQQLRGVQDQAIELQTRNDRLVVEQQQLVESLTREKVERLSAERHSLAAAASAASAEGRQRLQQQRLEIAENAQNQLREQLTLARQEQQQQLEEAAEAARVAAKTKAALDARLQEAQEENELLRRKAEDLEVSKRGNWKREQGIQLSDESKRGYVIG